MKFRMTLRILILIVSMTSFKSFAQGIDGTWIEAVRGCNLQLPESELEALVNRGGNTYLANSVLILNKGKFDVTVSDGDGCAELGLSHDLVLENGDVLRCGRESRNLGIYSQKQSNSFIFYATSNGGHYLGSNIKNVKIEIFDNVLKMTLSTRQCPRLIKYFIRSMETPLIT